MLLYLDRLDLYRLKFLKPEQIIKFVEFFANSSLCFVILLDMFIEFLFGNLNDTSVNTYKPIESSQEAESHSQLKTLI